MSADLVYFEEEALSHASLFLLDIGTTEGCICGLERKFDYCKTYTVIGNNKWSLGS